jgi:hypothetical protein
MFEQVIGQTTGELLFRVGYCGMYAGAAVLVSCGFAWLLARGLRR